MKRPVWMIATVLTLLLTGIVLARAGWFQARSAPAYHADSRGGKTHDSFSADASWRWRHCQPTHWRACLLQRQ